MELVLMNHPAASCISCTTLWLLVSPGPLSLLYHQLVLSQLAIICLCFFHYMSFVVCMVGKMVHDVGMM